jgi:hypothetical protein
VEQIQPEESRKWFPKSEKTGLARKVDSALSIKGCPQNRGCPDSG